MYSNFLNIYTHNVNRFIPTKEVTIRPSDKPFMNNAIRRKMRQRNIIHCKAKSSENPIHWQKYREFGNEIPDMVRKSKEEYRLKLTS